MRLTPQLVPPVLRATPWVGFAPAGVVAIGMAWVASRQPPDTMARLLPTRLAVLSVAIGVAFAFDDPAAVLSDPAPSQLILRRLIRTLSATLVASVLVLAVVFVASAGMDLVRVIPAELVTEAIQDPTFDDLADAGLPQFPGGRIALEAATVFAITLAIAAGVSRRVDPEPGRITTSVLLGVYAASWMVPDPYKPWADPSDQRWETGAGWWWAALVTFALVAIALSWDTRNASLGHVWRSPLPAISVAHRSS